MKINFSIYVFVALSFINSNTVGQNILWKQEFDALVNGALTSAYSGGLSYAKPELVDIDNDGDLDLFVGDAKWKVLFFRNTGDNNYFQWQMEENLYESFSSTFLDPTFIDIDDDNDYDAFIGDWNGQIRFLKNNGTPDIPLWEFITDNYDSIDVGYHSSPEFADIDNDGDFDLFVGNNNSKVFFYRNNGSALSPSFVLEDTSYFVQSYGDGIPEFIDIDADGDLDCFVSGSDIIDYYRNDGDANTPSWVLDSSPYQNIIGDGELGLTFGDLNGDGIKDMVMGEAYLGLRYYLNSGSSASASWTLITKHFATIDVGYPSYPTFADIDSDGDDDLFIGRYTYGIFILENDSDIYEHRWTFGEDPSIEDFNVPALSDLDGDGDLDLFLGKYNGKVSRYKNTGSPSSAIWTLLEADDPFLKVNGSSAPAFADIDDDGDSDLFLGEVNGKIYFFENIGTASNATWAAPDTFYSGIQINGYRSIPVFCDIDNDEDLDLFIGSYNTDFGTIYFYRNNGTKSSPLFLLETEKYLDTIDPAHAIPAFTDIDFDGDYDLFVGNARGGLSFYRNMGLDTTTTTVNYKYESGIPKTLQLAQNYPNPFNPTTSIEFSNDKTQFIVIEVFNMLGETVETLINQELAPGNYSFNFNGADLVSGAYILRLRANEFTSTKKMILLR